jgi:serine/threonine protein kinase
MICSKCEANNAEGNDYCTQCGQRLAATGQLSPNQTLGDRYLIVNTVDSGGMGAVYQAYDTRLNNMLVAVKEMSTKAVGEGNLEEAVLAFQKEAALLSSLQHPNLPRISDFFSTADNRWYLVMDFIKGENLATTARKRGRIPEVEVMRWARQLCDILDYLHTNKPPIIFRDLKPSNIMLTVDGDIKLIDFGIARHFKAGGTADTMAYGSIGFAPPEQYGDRQTDVRADIYALGATLHFLLTGQDPRKTPFTFTPPGTFGPINPDFEKAIMQAVQFNIEDRPQSIKEFLALMNGSSNSNAAAASEDTQTLLLKEKTVKKGKDATAGSTKAAPQTRKKAKKGKGKLVVLMLLLLLAGGGYLYYHFLGQGDLPQGLPVISGNALLEGEVVDKLFSPYEKEPNNTIQEAQSLQVNKVLTGNLQSDGDIDYYKFKLNSAGKVAVNLKHDQAPSGGWAVALLDQSNNRVCEMVSYADRLNVTSNNVRLSPGEYYIQIKPYGFSNLDYKLQVNYSNEDNNYEKENNNNIQSAQDIEVNQPYTGNIQTDDDIDYYKFELASPGKVQVNFKHEQSSSGGWRIAVLDGENNAITDFVSYNNTLNSDSVHLRLPQGSYLLRIKSYGFTNLDYVFTVNYTSEGDGYEKEWNGLIQNSQVIKLNQPYVGNIQADNDHDYYQIQLDTPGSIAVNFQHEQVPSGGWRVQILDANNNRLTEFVSYNNTLNVDSTSLRLPAGNYLIRVTSYGYSDADYKLTVNYKAE